jgi:hypothetical protein
VRARYTPNFATSAAKLVCRASRKGCSAWPGFEPWPTSHWKLEFEAILNFSPSPKIVISVSGRGVVKFLPLNMSSKHPAATSIGSPSSRPPTQRFQPSPVLPRQPPLMQSLSMSTINLPLAYSSQLGMQIDYPLPPIYSTHLHYNKLPYLLPYLLPTSSMRS